VTRAPGVDEISEPTTSTIAPRLRRRTIFGGLASPWWLLPATAVGTLGTFAGLYAQFSDQPKASQLILSAFSALVAGAGTYVALLAVVYDRERRSQFGPALPHRSVRIVVGYVEADHSWACWAAEGLGTLPEVGVAMQVLPMDGTKDADLGADDTRVLFILSASLSALPPDRREAVTQWIADAPDDRLLILSVEQVADEALLAGHHWLSAVGLSEMSLYQALATALLGDRPIPVPTAMQLPSQSGVWCPANGPDIEDLLDRNPDFQGREELIEAVHANLTMRFPDRLSSCLLWGMAGVGKSSIALEYAHRYATRYRIVKWISAELATQIVPQLTRLAESLGVPRDPDPERMIAELWEKLHAKSDWLLVFDNVEDDDEFAQLVPTASLRGHILITSRQRFAASVHRAIRVEKMAPDEATSFLLARTASTDRDSAARIAESLDYLPLALDVAATFVTETHHELAFYLELLQDAVVEVLSLPGPRAHPAAVSASLSVSVRSIAEAKPGAENLLRLFAMLAPDDIPREIVAAHPETLAALAKTRIAYELTLAELERYSLITIQGDTGGIALHRLVQLVVRTEMQTEGERFWLATAVRLLAAAFPTDVKRRDRWAECSRLVPHVIFAAQHEQRLSGTPGPFEDVAPTMGTLLHRASIYLLACGQYDQAASLMTTCIAVRRRVHGEYSVQVAETRVRFAELQYRRADLPDAHLAALEALRVNDEDGDAARLVDNLLWLARIEVELSELASAEARGIRALSIATESLPAESFLIADIDHLVGITRWRLGRFTEALTSMRDAYRIRSERKDSAAGELVDIMKDVGLVVRELALLAGDANGLREALRWYEEALRLSTQAHGDDYVEALRIRVDIGNILFELGDYTQARDLLEPAARDCRDAFGKHPNSALADLRLARVYAHDGAFERAEGLIRAAIGTYGEMFGQDHPYVAEALAELGPMLRAAGRMEEAERELRHVISFVEAAYGPDHPKLVVLLDELASVLRPSGSAECEQLTRRAASIRFTALNAGENSQD